MTKDEALKMRVEQDEKWEKLINREWQGLTDDEIEEFGLDLSNPAGEFVGLSDWKIFARAIEAKLKEKNSV
jgi:hypothetical protein